MTNYLQQSTTQKLPKMEQNERERIISPHIIIKSDLNFEDFAIQNNSLIKTYQQTYKDQKIIPGYNFQSLFRKKSQIRLARKKNKEEAQKKQSIKQQHCQKQMKNILKGHWTTEQNKRYHWFLQLHNKHFIYKYLRRTDKIFKSMANFIKTRQAQQCRSHHQKMEKKYSNFYQILLKLRQEFYDSPNPDLLRLQLEENGFALKEVFFISEYQLRYGKLQNEYGSQNDIMSNKNHDLNDEESQNQCSLDNNNILDENYSRQLKFNSTY